jgi:hypothetical protein
MLSFSPEKARNMALILMLIGLIGALLVYLAAQRRWQRIRSIARGLLVSYVTTVLLLALAEGYFRYVHADSEGRLAADNWIRRYYHENSWGYRDREWTETDWAGKTTVAVVGDSFTAGWGIENPADRFSDVLAAQLGSEYAVFNMGVPGSSTPEQLATAQRLPVQPDVIILQYFLNDIDYAVLSLGLSVQEDAPPPLMRESYLLNYLYSRVSAGFQPDYWAKELAHYDNPTIWQTHEAELNAFIDYAEARSIRLIVVIFPNMQDPVGSIPYVDRVAQVFEQRGQTDVLKLFDQVAAWQPSDVIVSPRDAHPSIAFHRLVGTLIYQQFFAS